MDWKVIFSDIVKIIYTLSGLVFYSLVYKFQKKFGKFVKDEEDVSGKVVIITGGSMGMGKASAREFAKRGAVVVIGDVNMVEGLKTVQEIQDETGNTNVKIYPLDLATMDSVQEFARIVSKEYSKIKILINNAGIVESSATLGKKTKDGFNLSMAVNHLGHFLLTNLLLSNIKKEDQPRIVSMSSTAQLASRLDLDDLMMDKSGFGIYNMLPYHNSKYCQALFTKELSKIVADTGIHVYALCPGGVNTPIAVQCINHNAFYFKLYELIFKPLIVVSPEEAASNFILYCALDKSIKNETGKMYRFRKHFDAANNGLDDNLAKRLWEKSAFLVKLEQRLSQFK